MSLELNDPPDSIHLYHVERMKTCCSTLLTISSFDKEVTQAIVLGKTPGFLRESSLILCFKF